MRYGITGNTQKEELWQPVADLIQRLMKRGTAFDVHPAIAQGLTARNLCTFSPDQIPEEANFGHDVDLMISFGGDGTLLRSAHQVGQRGTPLLGVNIGRLGFLADIEVEQLPQTIERLEQGEYRIERRMVLEVRIAGRTPVAEHWALNELVIRAETNLIRIETWVDDLPLNTYWADGLIIATPTGSTAYSLAAGGPLMVPGSGILSLTPIAPHTLTARPIILPATATLQARVTSADTPYTLVCDGRILTLPDPASMITIRRATHTVNLLKLPEMDYFTTIRNKLMWGQAKRR